MTDNNNKIEEIDKPQAIEQKTSDTSPQSTENGEHTQQFANSHPIIMPETVNQTEVQPLPAQEQVKEQKPIKKKIWDPEDLVAKLAKQKNELSPKIKLLALVKVNSVNWLCAQIEDEIGWYREEDFFTKFREINQCINLQIPPEIDYAKEVDTKLKENKQIKELKQQLDLVITQYENRVIYVQQQLDITETKLHTTTQHYKKTVTDLENRIADIFGQINQMTDISVGIRQNIILASQDELDIVSKTEAMNKIKTLANHLRQFRFEGNDEQSLDYLKIHFLDISHTLSEFIRKQGVLLSELHNLDKRWTKKWEAIFAEKESERKEKNEIVEMGRRKMKEFEETIQQLKAQHIKEIQEKDSKIDSLQNELKNHANINYIRTVLINFLTNPDFSVRETLLNVISTILKFSEGDLEKVKTVWENEHTSFLKKGSSTVSNWLNDRFFSNK